MSLRHHSTRTPLTVRRLPLLALAAVLAWGTAIAQGTPATAAAPAPASPPLRLAAPPEGAYTGAYIDFGEHEDEVTLERIESFAELTGKHQAVVAFTNAWERGHFPTTQARIIANSGAVPLILWNPLEKKVGQQVIKYDLGDIAAGRWDDYLDAWARDARAYGKPLLVAWGLEMNGNWFPWSGLFYGAGRPIPGSQPPLYQGPEAFKRAYRHIVDRVRAAGAGNIAWLFHVNNTSYPDGPWNRMASYYPGSKYVDWLAISAYGKQFAGEYWLGVEESILAPCRELAAIDPAKPLFIAEWGVGEFPKQGNKGDWIREAFAGMEHQVPRLGGAVFWHERWQNGDLTYSNLRANSSLEALTAYREGVSRPFWRATPNFEPAPTTAR